MDLEINSYPTCHSIFSVRGPFREKILFLKLCPFLAPGHNMSLFGLLQKIQGF